MVPAEKMERLIGKLSERQYDLKRTDLRCMAMPLGLLRATPTVPLRLFEGGH
jgi:hypothetical protein